MGNIKKLKENIKKQKSLIEKSQFEDSFKCIFGVNSYKEEYVKDTEKIMEDLLKCNK